MIKKVMFILSPIWVCMVLVLMLIDLRCLYKAVVTFDTMDCPLWIFGACTLSAVIALCVVIPFAFYNDFKG